MSRKIGQGDTNRRPSLRSGHGRAVAIGNLNYACALLNQITFNSIIALPFSHLYFLFQTVSIFKVAQLTLSLAAILQTYNHRKNILSLNDIQWQCRWHECFFFHIVLCCTDNRLFSVNLIIPLTCLLISFLLFSRSPTAAAIRVVLRQSLELPVYLARALSPA